MASKGGRLRGLLAPRMPLLPWVVAILQVGNCAIPAGAAAQLDWMYQNLAPYAAPPPPRYAPAYPPAYPGYYPPGYYGYRAPPATYRPPASADRKLVAELQQMLDDLGYDAGAADGSAGPQTAQALRAFRRDHGQPASGVITTAAVASVRSAWLDRRASAQPGPAAPDQAATAPSFDCAHAGTVPEHNICNSPRLAQLDVAVADAYAGASKTGSSAEQARLQAEQRAWMQTRDACGSDSACLERSMSTRLSELRALAPPAEEAPVLRSDAEPAAPEHWVAVSNTALSITGDVTFSPDRITFQNGKSLPLVPAGSIRMADGTNRRIDASLFRVTRPQDPALQRGNTLCGSPITFIAVWRPAPVGSDIDPRALAVFSGSTPPTGDDLGCATYSYEAGSNAAIGR